MAHLRSENYDDYKYTFVVSSAQLNDYLQCMEKW